MDDPEKYITKSTGDENGLAKSIELKLIDGSIVSANDITVSDQKLLIHNLQNYSGNYFLNTNNNCIIRCFNKTPNLLAIICEYTLDTEVNDADNVEIFLKDSLRKIGYAIIDV